MTYRKLLSHYVAAQLHLEFSLATSRVMQFVSSSKLFDTPTDGIRQIVDEGYYWHNFFNRNKTIGGKVLNKVFKISSPYQDSKPAPVYLWLDEDKFGTKNFAITA